MDANLDQAVVVALGANLPGVFGSPEGAIRAALAELEGVGLKPVRTSSIWRSRAWPDPRQPAYRNAVALVEPTHAPAEAMAALQRLERAFGARSPERNAARVLDLDLIAVGRVVAQTPELILPHPRAAERLFVMGPLAEIAPAWVHPTLGRTAAELARTASVGVDAAPG